MLFAHRRKRLNGRDRGERPNQNGQHQKSAQEKCHLAHGASYVMSLRCSGYRTADRVVIVSRRLIPLQMQIAQKNTDQNNAEPDLQHPWLYIPVENSGGCLIAGRMVRKAASY